MAPDAPAAAPADLVILIDVDNTLLDNDRIQADIREHLAREYCQGRHAFDAAVQARTPRADRRIDAIAEMLALGLPELLGGRYNA